MNTVYDVIKSLPTKYARFFIIDKNGKRKVYGDTSNIVFDLKNKSAKAGPYYLIREGKLVKKKIFLTNGEKFDLAGLPLIEPCEEPYKEIERLFVQYYNSVPSTKEVSKGYFACKNPDKMTIEELTEGIPRCQARYELEAFIMLSAICGYIPWENEKHFYWYSKEQRELVLFREWCH